MFGIGMSEMLIILAVALLVFGPTKLPEIAKSIAKGLKELRRAGDDLRSSVNFDLDDDKPRRPLPRTPVQPPATASNSATTANAAPSAAAGAASLGASVPTEPAAIPGSELASPSATAAPNDSNEEDVWPKPASDTTARGSVSASVDDDASAQPADESKVH